ncbi:N-formylglutamate amidohydrolase [Lacisediminimonas sp.]|uniref:N-formylglutamate amidohydrolase n=1 Tax=Lacisediminimonas sp. TaxID=3060582 RepID=UPI002718FDB6|nr:N-formylglutamate amidohydrolase [Lacisediminimonas sp.]MDO8299456.1 N-formylglutamate amidohydrolase [Lacisediminimonas sp.]
MKRFVVVSCEHGGNRVPSRFRPLFREHWQLLHSHQGYDKGALRLAREMSEALGGDHHYCVVSRLLVDLNRSVGHPGHFSPITAALDPAVQDDILDRYYHPYRAAVEHSIAAAIGGGRHVLHLSCHSFAREIDGRQRTAEVGLLFDPVRHTELIACRTWQQSLAQRMPALTVRLNYPYLGVDDGLITTLRGRFPDPRYAGIELEVRHDALADVAVRGALVQTLAALLHPGP